MSYETILYEPDSAVLTVTLNRPERLNAANDALLGELADAFRQAGRDRAIRAVLLTGAGRGFCAGQDLASVNDREASGGEINFGAHLRHTWNPVIRRIRALEKPVICAVNGVAAGAGMSLALACDLRYASETASFIQAFVNIGLVPDSGSTWTLQRLIGPARAAEMMIRGHKVSAQEALSWGLVSAVHPPDKLMEAVRTVAEEVAAKPTRAIGLIKRAMDFAATHPLDQTLEYEADLQDIAGATADHKEGVAAFLQKRPPHFTGG